jgi:hypothetical protein
MYVYSCTHRIGFLGVGWQDVKWVIGREYTPIDAVAQVLKNTALTDLRSLARTIGDFFISL